ncbi:MAG: M48 family metalloprotease [Oligoflexia bacterium]|nr:M48 family metalloprotease [Oligoflexia bacterium]
MVIFGLIFSAILASANNYFNEYLMDAVKGERDYCRLVVAPDKTEACLKKIDDFVSSVNSCDTSSTRYEEAKISDAQQQKEFLSQVEEVAVPARVKTMFRMLTENTLDLDWKLTAYNSEEFAAQSSIGGHIIISSKLLNSFTLGEVTAVLAHEMGHSVKRHSQQHGCLALAWTLKDQPLNLAFKTFSLMQGIESSAYPVGQAALALSHKAELEADAYAITLLNKSGINPMLMSKALEKLASPEGLVHSHPELKTRILKARDLGLKIQDTGFRYVNF